MTDVKKNGFFFIIDRMANKVFASQPYI